MNKDSQSPRGPFFFTIDGLQEKQRLEAYKQRLAGFWMECVLQSVRPQLPSGIPNVIDPSLGSFIPGLSKERMDIVMQLADYFTLGLAVRISSGGFEPDAIMDLIKDEIANAIVKKDEGQPCQPNSVSQASS